MNSILNENKKPAIAAREWLNQHPEQIQTLAENCQNTRWQTCRARSYSIFKQLA